MPTPQARAGTSSRSGEGRTRWSFASADALCLASLRTRFRGTPVRLELWDGTTCDLSDTPPVATIRFHDRAALVGLVLRPILGFGDAYTAGRIDVRGDLVEMLEAVNRAWPARPPARNRRRGLSARLGLPVSARDNIHHHYDLGNDFYRLWLDEDMVYTCAYFETPDATLEQAQRAKMDYVCRKLRLKPGDRVIEAGCGWGALALHMAREFGVTVRAYNISREQLAFARDRAEREGLADRVSFIDDDYRSIEGACDVFVSVGMLEHVGPSHYAALGRVIDRVLDRDHGRGLLHFIGRNAPAPFNPWISRHIFPGAYAPALSEVCSGVFQPWPLSIVDVENLRLHYARTLAHWLARFERHAADVRAMFDDRFVRMWRLYLASAEAGFASGDTQLFQVTFARSLDNALPLTRRDLYSSNGHGQL